MSTLCWDIHRCQCGGQAVMGIMSLIAHCDKCPRVYAHTSMGAGGGQWYADKDAANAEYSRNLDEHQKRNRIGTYAK